MNHFRRLRPTYAQELDILLMDEYKGRTVKKMFQGSYFMGRVRHCTALTCARYKAWYCMTQKPAFNKANVQ